MSGPTHDEMYTMIRNILGETLPPKGGVVKPKDLDATAMALTTMVQASYDPDCLPLELVQLRNGVATLRQPGD